MSQELRMFYTLIIIRTQSSQLLNIHNLFEFLHDTLKEKWMSIYTILNNWERLYLAFDYHGWFWSSTQLSWENSLLITYSLWKLVMQFSKATLLR